MFTSEIEVKGDKAFLKACYEALEPETEFKTERAHYTINLGKTLKIKIDARDATAFRAVATTITGLLSIVEKAWKQK
jgi:tRNA threonylcarbamoyladenosine modification (KEOPS) complex  Pcc1 subunit